MTQGVRAGSDNAGRLLSLDIVRGITVAFMILVNNSNQYDSFAPLLHAHWSGWTPTDLVFPTFLFLMGASLVFSLEARLRQDVGTSKLLAQIVRRAMILFAFGLIVNGFPHFHLDTLRIYGVLQRIAICYLCAASLYLWDRRATFSVVIVIVALVGYWAVLRYVPVPGFGVPGTDVPLLDPNGNLVAYVDRHIFPGRLYEGVRDPEGLLSDLPALGTTLLGVLAGVWLRSTYTATRKVQGLLLGGALGLLLGAIWGQWFPINKKLWTSSYVLWAAGWALIVLAACYWAVEVKRWRQGWTYPWLVFGTNAITVYMLAELLQSTLGSIVVHGHGDGATLQSLIYGAMFHWPQAPGLGSLAYAVTVVAVCFLPMVVLYRQQIFLKV